MSKIIVSFFFEKRFSTLPTFSLSQVLVLDAVLFRQMSLRPNERT